MPRPDEQDARIRRSLTARAAAAARDDRHGSAAEGDGRSAVHRPLSGDPALWVKAHSGGSSWRATPILRRQVAIKVPINREAGARRRISSFT